MNLVVISHSSCLQHDMGDEHPEQPARLYAINDALISQGLEFVIEQRDASAIDRESLCRVHDRAYVDEIFRRSPAEGHVWLDADTLMMPHSLDAAVHAAGAARDAVDVALSNQDQQVFCAVRPPGHHAERKRAMGFCIFNNVAVAAGHALDVHGLERVAIVDFDVHHGNGTEDIFRDDARVMFCSAFQSPFYPFSGEDSSSDHIISSPLPAGSDGSALRRVVTDEWLPRLDAFAPQLILVSAGFDGHREDDLAHWRLTEADYQWLAEQFLQLARRHCDGRMVICLEGGYALSALGRSVVAFLRALLHM